MPEPGDRDQIQGYLTKLRGFHEACADKNGIRPEMRRLVALRELGSFSGAVSRIKPYTEDGVTPDSWEALEEPLGLLVNLLDPVRHLPPRSFWLSHDDNGECDVLLPVASRKIFDKDMQAALAEASDTLPLSLLMMDLDHFKKVNDSFGHRYGDEILKAVAGAVKVACQGKAKPYRYGGEELAVLIPNCGIEEARAFGERLRRMLAVIAIDEKGPVVTVSVGVAECNGEKLASYDALVNAADSALYQAKKAGRNRVVTFRPDHREADQKDLRLGSNISITVNDGQLRILYQVGRFTERFEAPKKITHFLTMNLPGLQLHLDELVRRADEEKERKAGG
ncbi:MAG: GGDEF domain-containing protein [Thermodesulfobacteriota bacterium]